MKFVLLIFSLLSSGSLLAQTNKAYMCSQFDLVPDITWKYYYSRNGLFSVRTDYPSAIANIVNTCRFKNGPDKNIDWDYDIKFDCGDKNRIICKQITFSGQSSEVSVCHLESDPEIYEYALSVGVASEKVKSRCIDISKRWDHPGMWWSRCKVSCTTHQIDLKEHILNSHDLSVESKSAEKSQGRVNVQEVTTEKIERLKRICASEVGDEFELAIEKLIEHSKPHSGSLYEEICNNELNLTFSASDCVQCLESVAVFL